MHNLENQKVYKDSKKNISKNDESLLSNTNNTEISVSKNIYYNKERRKCGLYCGLVTGLILCTFGTLFLIWTPFDIVMNSRLEMIPGFPPFEWWANPPDNVVFAVYVFNITNSEEFLNGSDKKLKVQEIGPIMYKEIFEHKNIHFNNNGTLTYTIKRTAKFIPDETFIDLKTKIIVPNYAILGMVSFLHDISTFAKMGINVLLRGLKSPLFIETTIYDFLWNTTDSFIDVAKPFASDVITDVNMGMLHRMFSNFEDTVTVNIGSKNGHKKFFTINRFDGSEYIPGHGDSCPDKLEKSSEGALYHQYVDKNTTLYYWRKTLCKVIELNYKREEYLEDYKINAYRFEKAIDTYDRKQNLEQDCYKGDPVIPNGLFDVSKCYNGISMAASFPHFLYASEEVQNYVEGLNPTVEKHQSYLYVEPFTGIPIEGKARSQSNMMIRDISGFRSDMAKFSNIALPMFWLELVQRGLPNYVQRLLYFTSYLCPTYQYYFIALLFIFGVLFLVTFIRKICRYKNYQSYKRNTIVLFEKESFINRK